MRVARGRYALADCPDPWVTAHRLDAVVSHASAAQVWGLGVLSAPVVPHVIVGRHRHDLARVPAAVHWANLAPQEMDGRLRVTTPLRTVLDCARALPFADALAIADSALRSALVGGSELRAAALGLRGAGRRRVLRVAMSADGRAASPLESAMRSVFIEAQISGFEPQLVVRDGPFYARVDLGDAARRIVAEADSFEHHGHRAALARDCRRYTELVIRGWRVLRFAWEDVMFDRAWVVEAVQAAVEGSAHRPAGGQKSPLSRRALGGGEVRPSGRSA